MCTDFGIQITDITSVEEPWAFSGRNMDWLLLQKLTNQQNAKLVPYAKGEKLSSKAPDNTEGLIWESMINTWAISAYKKDTIVDGMNEEGLTFSANMMDCSLYPEDSSPENYSKSLGISQLGLWALTQFACVDELIQAFRSHIDGYFEYSNDNGRAVLTPFKQNPEDKIYIHQGYVLRNCWKTPGLHFAFHDKEGKAFIVEFREGKVIGTTYEKAFVWAMTNDPPLPQHINNLAGYNHLNGGTPPPVEIYGQSINLVGSSNMKGLPDSASPEDRYVRVSKQIQFLPQPKNSNEALTAVMNIADRAKVYQGDASMEKDGKIIQDQTIYQVFRDSMNKIMYWRTDTDSQLKHISIVDSFSSGRKLKSLKLNTSTTQTSINMTNKVQESFPVITI